MAAISWSRPSAGRPGWRRRAGKGGNFCPARPADLLPVRCANDESGIIIVCCALQASRASLRCIIRRCPCRRDGDKSFANISCNCHIRVVVTTRWRSLTRCPRPLFIYVAEIAAASAKIALVECLACLNSLRTIAALDRRAMLQVRLAVVWASCRYLLVVHCTVVG